MSDGAEITRLLRAWSGGDTSARDRLVELVYPELRRIAARHISRERSGHTLQSTALVHEAYLRLARQEGKEWQDRAHFFAVATRVIRSILVDHARARNADKRGAGVEPLRLVTAESLADKEPGEVDLLDLDAALSALEKLDAQQSEIVELRFFGGLSVEETAEVVGVSPATVKRDWVVAKAWIRRHMGGEHVPA